ncbi:gap junction Cx32.2 protein-like [Stegastes partitus]|uniref:Gap junction Cx32.2 protein-like n=1 Tax=Stegastes partitus TaxID=144197 RepID=A0A9Y4KN17_9TELE|nr:PREDICTED: gap junction Cx32.2 protein-like [Stegastes partitus]XP_008294414.1 PREDICTED: gap junction Cx32.2 protein-like [Stegastes partitus]
MGDWSYLSSLLDKVQSHSTVVGKIWMSVLFLFRIFVLGAAADKVWGDELSEFSCDSLEPGCEHACYNWKFPISYVHYWVLQITFVSTPTLVYLGHAMHVIHKEKRLKQQDGEKKSRYTDDRGKVKIKGILFCTYMIQLLFKILLEVGFSVGQFYIFGSVFMESFFHCAISPPCARFSGALCYISRPTEKTVFIIFMLVVSGISVLLNIIEILYLLCNRRRNNQKKLFAQQQLLTSQYQPSNQGWPSSRYGGFHLPPPPAGGVTELSDSISKEKFT